MPPPRADPAPGVSALVIAAHGGCGASTLAEHLPGALEVDPQAPAPPPGAPRTGSATPWVVVVAAATPDGSAAAAACLHRLHLAGYPSSDLHLALVGDGRGPVPVSVRARVRLLHPGVAGMHLLPYVHRWRYQAHQDRTPARRYTRATEALRAALATHPVAPARSASSALNAYPSASSAYSGVGRGRW